MPAPIPSSTSDSGLMNVVIPAVIAAVVSVISTIVSVIGVILGNRATVQSFKHQKEKDENDFRLQQTEDERQSIRSQLGDFYGPLQQHLGKSAQLYEQFCYGKPADFRTLIALLAGTQFEGNDEAILQEILKVTEDIDKLILAHGGLVNDLTLQRLLSQATAHFSYMRLAHRHKLRGDLERFANSSYPTELNQRVNDTVTDLQQKLQKLNERSLSDQ